MWHVTITSRTPPDNKCLTSFTTWCLKLINKIFMTLLGKQSTFLGIKVYIINPKIYTITSSRIWIRYTRSYIIGGSGDCQVTYICNAIQQTEGHVPSWKWLDANPAPFRNWKVTLTSWYWRAISGKDKPTFLQNQNWRGT